MVTCKILDNGDLEVTANEETREWLREHETEDYWGKLADLFEPYSCNGSFTPFEPSDGTAYQAPFVGLTSAPCIAEEYSINDDNLHEVVGRCWWYPSYAINDPMDDLRDTGRTVFTLASEES